MRSVRTLSAAIVTAMSLALFAAFSTPVFASSPGAPRPVLVELFTSEGCSSCPPADDLLRQLNGRTTANGQLIIGLSEHVTYWNDLGWTDPYSQSAYTDRQSAYGHHFNLTGVYTPQAVINGDHEVVGSDANAVLGAIRSEARPSPVTVHIDSASLAGSTLAVTYTISGSAPAGSIDLFAVIADDMASSHVLHGENSGRLLAHVSVARSMTRIATLKPAATQTQTVELTAPVQQQPASGRHIILFAQATFTGRVFSVESKAF